MPTPSRRLCTVTREFWTVGAPPPAVGCAPHLLKLPHSSELPQGRNPSPLPHLKRKQPITPHHGEENAVQMSLIKLTSRHFESSHIAGTSGATINKVYLTMAPPNGRSHSSHHKKGHNEDDAIMVDSSPETNEEDRSNNRSLPNRESRRGTTLASFSQDSDANTLITEGTDNNRDGKKRNADEAELASSEKKPKRTTQQIKKSQPAEAGTTSRRFSLGKLLFTFMTTGPPKEVVKPTVEDVNKSDDESSTGDNTKAPEPVKSDKNAGAKFGSPGSVFRPIETKPTPIASGGRSNRRNSSNSNHTRTNASPSHKNKLMKVVVGERTLRSTPAYARRDFSSGKYGPKESLAPQTERKVPGSLNESEAEEMKREDEEYDARLRSRKNTKTGSHNDSSIESSEDSSEDSSEEYSNKSSGDSSEELRKEDYHEESNKSNESEEEEVATEDLPFNRWTQSQFEHYLQEYALYTQRGHLEIVTQNHGFLWISKSPNEWTMQQRYLFLTALGVKDKHRIKHIRDLYGVDLTPNSCARIDHIRPDRWNEELYQAGLALTGVFGGGVPFEVLRDRHLNDDNEWSSIPPAQWDIEHFDQFLTAAGIFQETRKDLLAHLFPFELEYFYQNNYIRRPSGQDYAGRPQNPNDNNRNNGQIEGSNRGETPSSNRRKYQQMLTKSFNKWNDENLRAYLKPFGIDLSSISHADICRSNSNETWVTTPPNQWSQQQHDDFLKAVGLDPTLLRNLFRSRHAPNPLNNNNSDRPNNIGRAEEEKEPDPAPEPPQEPTPDREYPLNGIHPGHSLGKYRIKRTTPTVPGGFHNWGSGNGIRIDTIPYPVKTKGIGIYRPPKTHPKSRVIVLKDGTQARFSEPSNRVGLKLHMLTILRYLAVNNGSPNRRDNQGEPDCFTHIYHQLTESVQTQAGYSHDPFPEVQHQRRQQQYWRIQCGFNDGGDFNPELRNIAIIYCRIRLGIIASVDTAPNQRSEPTELDAAVQALRIYHKESSSDGVGHLGRGPAWLLGVHLLNDHLDLCGLPVVLIHPDVNEDTELVDQRAANTKSIYVGDRRVVHRVESRVNERNQIIWWLKSIGEDPTGKIPVDRGPPSHPPPVRAKPSAPTNGRRHHWTS